MLLSDDYRIGRMAAIGREVQKSSSRRHWVRQ